jgi:hypothetical protein
VRRRAGDHHNHNASNHGYSGTPANGPRFADDYDDAHGRRLLITKSRSRLRLLQAALWALRISKSCPEFDRPQTGGYSREWRSGFLSRRFCALRFLFLYLTYYGGDRLKLFAITEIH